jgi:LuxR family transcriptional regulator, quorum-sensing system regulator BjaR1
MRLILCERIEPSESRVPDDIFKAIETFDTLTTSDRVAAALKTALVSVGHEYFCLNLFPRPNESFDKVIIACDLPKAWLDLYLRENFAAVDPAIRHCRETVLPFAYREAPCDSEREPRAAEVVRRARDFGVGNGMLFPIASPVGPVGDMWIGGIETVLGTRELSAVHMLALTAFYKLQELVHPKAATVTLSGREREVLTWAADGKTAWQIGELLQISQRTVEWYIQQAVQKLGARNRMQAVVIAARDRLIDI